MERENTTPVSRNHSLIPGIPLKKRKKAAQNSLRGF